MFIKNDMAYADAGNYLIDKKHHLIGYQIEYCDNIVEAPIDLNNTIRENDMLFFEGFIAFNVAAYTKSSLKSGLVKLRYTNDAQIAIMCNQNESIEDKIEWEKMQEWRAWSSTVAKYILENFSDILANNTSDYDVHDNTHHISSDSNIYDSCGSSFVDSHDDSYDDSDDSYDDSDSCSYDDSDSNNLDSSSSN